MAREHPLRDLGLAVSLLTLVPTPARWPDDGRTQVAAWFPAVGAVLGAAGYAVVKLAETFGVLDRAPLVVAAIVVALWAGVTRLLHWDGLADVADGWWGAHEPARRLEIMSDSRTGAFGATTVALVAILEVAAIAAIAPAHQSLVLLVPLFARCAATAAAWLGQPARPDGLGRSVMGSPTPLAAIITAGTIAPALALLWTGLALPGVVLGVLALTVALGVPHLLAGRFGGVTGDVMGASVLLTETVLFVVVALVA